MNNTTIAALIIGALAVIAAGWWTLSPLFLNTVVDETLPQENMQVEVQGSFIDADSFHKASGTAQIVTIEGAQYLTFENFQTTNGPDLRVYLATDKEASEFIDLGDLKGNIGNQNYEIPEGTDLEQYDEVLIWCRAFSVLFGSAELQ